MNVQDRRALKRAANRYGRYIGLLNKNVIRSNHPHKGMSVRDSIAHMLWALTNMPESRRVRTIQADLVSIKSTRREQRRRRNPKRELWPNVPPEMIRSMEKAFELTPIRDVVHPSKLINHELLFSDARQQMPDPDLKRRLERIPLPPFLASLDKLFHDKNITLVTPKAGRPPLSIEDSTIWIAKVDRPSDDSLIIERGKVRNEYRGELNQFLASRWADGPIFKDPPPLDPNSIAGQIVARAELEEKARALMLGPYLTNIEAQLDSNGNPISYDFVDKKENPDG